MQAQRCHLGIIENKMEQKGSKSIKYPGTVCVIFQSMFGKSVSPKLVIITEIVKKVTHRSLLDTDRMAIEGK